MVVSFPNRLRQCNWNVFRMQQGNNNNDMLKCNNPSYNNTLMQTIFTPQATSPTFVHLQLLHSKTIPSIVGAFLKYCNVMFSVSIYQDLQWTLKSNTITTPSKVIRLMVSSCKYTYWFEIMLKVFLKQIEWWGWIFAFFQAPYWWCAQT